MAHSEAFLKMIESCKKEIIEYTCDEVFKRLDAGEKLNLIDTREDLEWQQGRIQSSTHIGKGVIERDIEEKFPEKNSELILYCGGGFRSAIAAKSLKDMGYTKAISMDGGIREWRSKNYPCETK